MQGREPGCPQSPCWTTCWTASPGTCRSWASKPCPHSPHASFSSQVLTALGKTWHPEHFTCAHCGKELDKGPYFEQGGRAFCEEDYHQAFSPRCAYCAGPIREKVLTALEQTWHPEHFFCAHCGKVGFTGGSFFELEGRPYCELHFHQRQGTICHGCGHPVTGRCITAAGRRYHPEHFVCTYCLGRLHKGTVRECGDKMYCQPCYDKLFTSLALPLDLKQ
uniref:Leupaxin n=1 Tax=Cyanoderma ruficeps TaxID=181631 RepID=A0A8C3R837_9PASS